MVNAVSVGNKLNATFPPQLGVRVLHSPDKREDFNARRGHWAACASSNEPNNQLRTRWIICRGLAPPLFWISVTSHSMLPLSFLLLFSFFRLFSSLLSSLTHSLSLSLLTSWNLYTNPIWLDTHLTRVNEQCSICFTQVNLVKLIVHTLYSSLSLSLSSCSSFDEASFHCIHRAAFNLCFFSIHFLRYAFQQTAMLRASTLSLFLPGGLIDASFFPLKCTHFTLWALILFSYFSTLTLSFSSLE